MYNLFLESNLSFFASNNASNNVLSQELHKNYTGSFIFSVNILTTFFFCVSFVQLWIEVQVESNASWKNLTCQINCVSVVGYWIECITISLRSLLYHFWNNQLINQKLLFCAHLFYLSNHKLKPSFYSWHQGFWKSFTRPNILLLVVHTMLTLYRYHL